MLGGSFGCKSVRDERGDWSAVDAYLARSHGTRVTHGLCADCFEQLRPSLAQERLE